MLAKKHSLVVRVKSNPSTVATESLVQITKPSFNFASFPYLDETSSVVFLIIIILIKLISKISVIFHWELHN